MRGASSAAELMPLQRVSFHCSCGCSDSTASLPSSTRIHQAFASPHHTLFLRRSDCFCLLFHTQSLFKDMHLEASLFLDTPATVSLLCPVLGLFPLYMLLTFSFYVYEFSDEGAVAPRSRSTSAGSSALDATTCSSSVWRNILLPPQNMHRKNIEQHANMPASLNNACQNSPFTCLSLRMLQPILDGRKTPPLQQWACLPCGKEVHAKATLHANDTHNKTKFTQKQIEQMTTPRLAQKSHDGRSRFASTCGGGPSPVLLHLPVRLRASSNAADGLFMCASHSAFRTEDLFSICRSPLWNVVSSPFWR